MSTVYGEEGLTGTGDLPPKRINFGWLGESWKLFTANASIWIAAIIIGLYGPVIFDGFVFGAWGLSLHVSGIHAGSLRASIAHMPHGFRIGLFILNIIYINWIWTAIMRMAVKQVYGQSISFRDIFSGGPIFARMLLLCLVYSILVSVGSLLVVLPGILAAALFLPSFAMAADGFAVPDAIARGARTVWHEDRAVAMGFIFVVLVIVALSFGTGIGPLATIPMFALISALAYRDLIGLKNSQHITESLGTILGFEGRSHRPRSADGTEEGDARLSLTGERLDENGNEISTPPQN